MSTKPRVLVLRAPGTNCEAETAFAFELAGGQPDQIHVNRLIEQPRISRDFQILCVPGGFSYGDDIAAGRILASQLVHHLRDLFDEFRQANKLVLGICNGFQVLVKTGLLVEEDQSARPVTLTWNDSGRYEARWVTLQKGNTDCVFLRNTERMYLPVAHAEGRFVVRDDSIRSKLEDGRQLALRYVTPEVDSDRAGGSNGDVPFPLNPNGSDDNIAGICDATGRVFGLMPHPERYIDPTHHPQWTRQGLDHKPAGRWIFENAIAYFN